MDSNRPGEDNSNGEFRNLKYLQLIATASNWKHILSYSQNTSKIQLLNTDYIGNVNFVLVHQTGTP